MVLLMAIVAGSSLAVVQPSLAAGPVASMDSPAVPYASDTFTWTVGAPGSTIQSVSLSGCWDAGDVVSATANTGRVLVNRGTGDITLSNGRALSAPVTVTVQYTEEYQSQADAVTMTSIELRARSSGDVAGPNCQPPAPPNAPSAVAAVQHDGFTTLTWAKPWANGGFITGYTVTCDPACPEGATGLTTDGATTTTNVADLVYGQSYTFQVTATNAYGTSDVSTASNTVAFDGSPGAPTSITAVQLDGSTTISWAAPAEDRGVITGYSLTCDPACPPDAPGLATDGATTTTDVSDLVYGHAYTFRVSATNRYGTGPASVPSDAVVFAAAPGASGYVTASAFDRRADISWRASADNGSPIQSYRVRVYLAETDALVHDTTVTNCCGTTVYGLSNGTDYRFTVQATNAYGTGPLSYGGFTVVGPPAKPRVNLALPGDGYAYLGWSVTNDGGQPVTRYEITAYSCTPGVVSNCSSQPTLDWYDEFDKDASPGWEEVRTDILQVGDQGTTVHGGDYEFTGLTNMTIYAFELRVGTYDYLSEPAWTTVMPAEGWDGCKRDGGGPIC